jgi:hypothetical protein
MIPSFVLAQTTIPSKPMQEADPARIHCPVGIELPQNGIVQSNEQAMQAANPARTNCPVGIALPSNETLQSNEQAMQAADSSVIHHQEIEPETIPAPEVNPNPNMTKSSTITDVNVVLYPTPATRCNHRVHSRPAAGFHSGVRLVRTTGDRARITCTCGKQQHLERSTPATRTTPDNPAFQRHSTGEENGALLSFNR